MVTKTSHHSQTGNMTATTQCNNGMETNSVCMLIPKKTKTKQIDIAVDNKISSELADLPKTGRAVKQTHGR